MEIFIGFIFLILLIGVPIAYYARKEYKTPDTVIQEDRTEKIEKTDKERIPTSVDTISGRYQPHQNDSPPIRKNATREICKFFDGEKITKFIVLDVETNGLDRECSVLSCSAIKYEINTETYDTTEIGRFDHYYFPIEEFDPSAIYVNGLTRDVIAERRGKATYTEHFQQDDDFKTFCNGVLRFVGHNISFDMQFLPFLDDKKTFCTMMTNTDIVRVHFMVQKNEWKWPKLSETAIHYGVLFNESDLHSSMYDAEMTAKIFLKMLESIKANGNDIEIEIDNSPPNFDRHYVFIWQLRNINESLASQCKVGEVVNLTKDGNTDNINCLGVATRSGEHLGEVDSPDIRYHAIYFIIDLAIVSAKIKQIFTKNEKIEAINIEVSINVNRKEQKKLFALDREAKGIISNAKTLEETNPEKAVFLYKKAIEILKGIDQQCDKYSSTWREQRFPIQRLSLVLERQGRYQECLDEIKGYERVIDKKGLYAGEKEKVEKRKGKIMKKLKAVNKTM
jgi:DNA polymerase III subunit epsilon